MLNRHYWSCLFYIREYQCQGGIQSIYSCIRNVQFEIHTDFGSRTILKTKLALRYTAVPAKERFPKKPLMNLRNACKYECQNITGNKTSQFQTEWTYNNDCFVNVDSVNAFFLLVLPRYTVRAKQLCYIDILLEAVCPGLASSSSMENDYRNSFYHDVYLHSSYVRPSGIHGDGF